MIVLLLRRARAQWPLLASLLVLLTLGATLLGTCALLVTSTSDRAVEIAAARARADDVAVTAYTVTVSAGNARTVVSDTRALLTSSLAPFPVTTSASGSSVMHRLPMASDEDQGVLGEAYLSGVENLRSRAALVAGRWPGGTAGPALETVLFDTTARRLGLRVGSRVHLGAAVGRDPAPPVDVVVVGLVHPLPDAGWDRDVLGGAGVDDDPEDVAYARAVTAYGPFLVTLDDLLAGGSALARMEVVAHPDLSAPTGPDLDRLTSSVLGADRRLAGTLGDRVRIERVASRLPQILDLDRGQQQLTAGSVLALLLIGVVLTAIALALAGRLTTGVRADESLLFAALGVGGGQRAVVATVEAAALALVAAVLAVPLSAVLHSALTHLPPLAGAGLATGPAVTTAQVTAIGAGALALAVLHVVLAVRPAAGSGDRRSRRDVLAQSGADLLLIGLAAVSWWQLRAQPAGAGTRADAVRVLAPALLLAAGTAVMLRVVPPALRAAERLAGRARGLVLPLAAFQAARRPQAYAAGLLIGLACAAATFGTAFAATWDRSQHDQADLSVGTDFAVTLDAPPVTGQGAAVSAATGGTVSPVAGQSIAVGQWLGGAGDAPRLVAVDTARTGVGPGLAPAEAVDGPALPRGATVTFAGTATGTGPVVVTPRLLLQDAVGLRTTCDGPAVVLDGRARPLRGCAPVDGLRLVAVALPVTSDSPGVGSDIDVTMTLPASRGTVPWIARAAVPGTGQLASPTVRATAGRLTFHAGVQFSDPDDSSRLLVATTFAAPAAMPVAVSTRFAADVNAVPGSKLSLTFGTTPIAAVVTRIIPAVPSQPRAAAALADVDALSRALVTRGDFDSPVTAWWVDDPAPGAAAKVAALHIGESNSRTAETARLTGSPLRASLPATLRVLVAAAVALLLGGVVLHVAYDVQLRALEVARLRGLGVSRRDIRAALLAEHAAVLLPLLLTGTVVGAVATRVVAPLLIRSDTGAAPVPPALADWPWAAETALLGLLIAGSAVAVAVVVTVQARRADAAHLRMSS